MSRPRRDIDVDVPEHHAFYQEQKQKKCKNQLLPGPWSKIETSLSVKAKFVKHESKNFNFPPILGFYFNCDTGYTGGGYRARVKITTDDWKELVKKHGIDEVLVACEKSLNCHKDLLGRVVICDLWEDKGDYAICMIKTTKRNISKFQGIKYGVLQVF